MTIMRCLPVEDGGRFVSCIGLGQIGREGFRAFLHYDSVTDLPLLMETPVDDRRRDAQNLQTVKRLAA